MRDWIDTRSEKENIALKDSLSSYSATHEENVRLRLQIATLVELILRGET